MPVQAYKVAVLQEKTHDLPTLDGLVSSNIRVRKSHWYGTVAFAENHTCLNSWYGTVRMGSKYGCARSKTVQRSPPTKSTAREAKTSKALRELVGSVSISVSPTSLYQHGST